jgi:hypothetical protein
MGILEELFANPHDRTEERVRLSLEAADSANQRRLKGQERRIRKLEADVAMLSLVNALLIRKFMADTGKTKEEIRQELAELDLQDGVEDGGLDTDELRRIVDLPLDETEEPRQSPVKKIARCPRCDRILVAKQGRCMYCGCGVLKKSVGEVAQEKIAEQVFVAVRKPAASKPMTVPNQKTASVEPSTDKIPASRVAPAEPVTETIEKPKASLARPTITAQDMLTKYKKTPPKNG